MAEESLQEIRAELARLRAKVEGQERRGHRRRAPRRALPAVLMALLVALIPLSLLAAHPFTDLNPGSVHNANIDAIYNAGVTRGCVPDQEYCPTANVTREEMASFLARLGGLGINPPVANAKTAQTVPDGSITTAKLSATGSTAGQVLTSNGSAVSWQAAVAGPTGPQGPQGPQGLQGPAGQQGPAGPVGILDIEIETLTANVVGMGGAIGEATVPCDAGRVVVGGGVSSAPNVSFSVQLNYPSSETAWTARIANNTGTAFTLTIYAVCATIVSP